MINAKISTDGTTYTLFAEGHAESAEYGKDLVCAAASTLVYATARAVEMGNITGALSSPPAVSLEEGEAMVSAEAAEGYGPFLQGIFYAIASGFDCLSEDNPDNVNFNFIFNSNDGC